MVCVWDTHNKQTKKIVSKMKSAVSLGSKFSFAVLSWAGHLTTQYFTFLLSKRRAIISAEFRVGVRIK